MSRGVEECNNLMQRSGGAKAAMCKHVSHRLSLFLTSFVFHQLPGGQSSNGLGPAGAAVLAPALANTTGITELDLVRAHFMILTGLVS